MLWVRDLLDDMLGAASVEFQEDRREKDVSDGTLTFAALDHEVPIHVEIHSESRRLALGCVDSVIERDRHYMRTLLGYRRRGKRPVASPLKNDSL